MRKLVAALFLSGAMSATACANSVGSNANTNVTCDVTRVLDGDTIQVANCTPHNPANVRIRLSGIDAPELPTPAGEASKLALISWLSYSKVELATAGPDKYGRTLAAVYRAGDAGQSANDWLIANHYARVWR
jgi:endonuclease YncB( thermonuclease family)